MKEQDVQIMATLDMPGLTLFERLEIERRRLGLKEDDFAEHIGVGPSTWLAVRKAYRQPTDRFYVPVLRRFPELEGHIYRHLKFRALSGGEE